MNTTIPDRATLVAMYQTMSRIKQNDERVIAAIMAGKITTPYYSSRGQECIPAAIATQLTSEDYLVTIYRGVHDLVAKGVPLNRLWAEFMGKETAPAKERVGLCILRIRNLVAW